MEDGEGEDDQRQNDHDAEHNPSQDTKGTHFFPSYALLLGQATGEAVDQARETNDPFFYTPTVLLRLGQDVLRKHGLDQLPRGR